MPRSLKGGIVGAGFIGQVHLAAYQRLQHLVSIVGLAETDPIVASIAARKYGSKYVFQNLQQMIQASGLDFVDICLPVHLHKEHVISALESGLDVLCEKPLAATTNEIEEMRRTADKQGRILFPGYMKRFHPAYEYVRTVVTEKRMGTTGALLMKKHNISPESNWRYTKRLAGGGSLLDVGSHMIDLLVWWFGTPRVTYSAVRTIVPRRSVGGILGRKEIPVDVEDFAELALDYTNGPLVRLSCSWLPPNVPGEAEECILLADHGSLNVNGLSSSPVSIYSEGHHESPDNLHCEWADLFAREEEHFVKCILAEQSPIVRVTEALEVQRVIESAYSKSTLGGFS